MKHSSDHASTDHKGDRAFLCQNTRTSWYESTLDISSRMLNPAVVRPNAQCSAAQKLTHGSTQQCHTNAYAPPFAFQSALPSTNETKCSSGRSLNSDVLM